MASIIPEVLNHFNIYNGANALVGVSGEVELPELEAITDTVEGTGVLGEIEDPVTGQFSSATITEKYSKPEPTSLAPPVASTAGRSSSCHECH